MCSRSTDELSACLSNRAVPPSAHTTARTCCCDDLLRRTRMQSKWRRLRCRTNHTAAAAAAVAAAIAAVSQQVRLNAERTGRRRQTASATKVSRWTYGLFVAEEFVMRHRTSFDPRRCGLFR